MANDQPNSSEYGFYATTDVTTGGMKIVGELSNVVVYRGRSPVPSQVGKVELVLDVCNERTEAFSIGAYKPIVERLFEQLQLEIPNGLLDAIDKRQAAGFDEVYGRVELVCQTHPPGFELELRIRPALQRGRQKKGRRPD
jgi:hypothetical protein